jgi:hypothetical protein
MDFTEDDLRSLSRAADASRSPSTSVVGATVPAPPADLSTRKGILYH